MFKVKYCVASVSTAGGTPHVQFLAHDDWIGMCVVGNWNDPRVRWFDTEEKAMGLRMNPNECVISRGFEEEKEH